MQPHACDTPSTSGQNNQSNPLPANPSAVCARFTPHGLGKRPSRNRPPPVSRCVPAIGPVSAQSAHCSTRWRSCNSSVPRCSTVRAHARYAKKSRVPGRRTAPHQAAPASGPGRPCSPPHCPHRQTPNSAGGLAGPPHQGRTRPGRRGCCHSRICWSRSWAPQTVWSGGKRHTTQPRPPWFLVDWRIFSRYKTLGGD